MRLQNFFTPQAKGQPFVIVTLSGGGVRSLAAIEVALQLEARLGCPLHECVDAFGVVSGSVFPIMHTLMPHLEDRSIEAARDSFVAHAPNIFPSAETQAAEGFWLKGKFSQARNLLTQAASVLTSPLYDPKPLAAAARSLAKGYGLNQMRGRFFAVACDAKTAVPIAMHNFQGHDEYSGFDTVMATTAAPSLFPLAKVQNRINGGEQILVDGYLSGNNPSQMAINLALQHGVKLQDIVLVSIGTGLGVPNLPKHIVKGSLLEWMSNLRLLEAMSDARVHETNQTCAALLGERYIRLDLAQDLLRAPYDASPAALRDNQNLGKRIIEAQPDLFDRALRYL